MTDQVPSIQNLSAETMTSNEIIQLFQRKMKLEGIKIGALSNLTGFLVDTAHVIYFVKERGVNYREEPTGGCVCMIIQKDNSITLELSNSLNEFWNHLERKGDITFSDVSDIIHEIEYFLDYGEPKIVTSYIFHDGKRNERLHRSMRSSEKCGHLKSIFGYELLASDA